MRSEVLDWSSWKNVLKNASFVGEKSFVLHILGSTNAAELTERGLTGSCWISVPQGCRNCGVPSSGMVQKHISPCASCGVLSKFDICVNFAAVISRGADKNSNFAEQLQDTVGLLEMDLFFFN